MDTREGRIDTRRPVGRTYVHYPSLLPCIYCDIMAHRSLRVIIIIITIMRVHIWYVARVPAAHDRNNNNKNRARHNDP